MSHVSYEWVTSHINESRLIWMSQSRMTESYPIWLSHFSRDCSLIRRRSKWPRSWVWIQRNSHRLCPTLQKWMSHVSYEWVISHATAVWYRDDQNGQVRGCKSRGTPTDYVQHRRSESVMCGMNESCLAWLQFDTETLEMAKFVGVNSEEVPQTMFNAPEVTESGLVWRSHVSHECSLRRRRLKWPSSWV